ncbi:MAG: hypothetical protein WCT52_05885 [Candidatus Micrarchaeia archaeon]
MGEFFSPKVSTPPLKYMEHNCESFAGSFKFNRAIQLENYILFGGLKHGVDTHKITSKKLNEFTSPSDSITKRFHPDAGVFLYKRFMEEAVQKMKGKKDPESKSGASAYDHIFYASDLLRVKPAGLMALLYCENSNLRHENTSRNLVSRLKGNADRGLFQISDGARLSMNEPAFIREFLGVMRDKDGACPRLNEMAGFFGIKPADYNEPYELAKALIGKITEYDKGEFNKSTKKYGVVEKDKVYDIKYNTFAAAMLFSVNLAKYEGNYQVAAGSYKRGRVAVNNYLEPKPLKLEKKQGESSRNFIKRVNREKTKVKEREDELADYSHKFWSYFSAFDAYHSGTAHFKEFRDEVAFFYDRTIRENSGGMKKH